MMEPVAKKLRGVVSYDCAYKEEWADYYAVCLVNGNKGAFYCIHTIVHIKKSGLLSILYALLMETKEHFIVFLKKKCKLYT